MPAIDAFDPAARNLLARTADILSEEDRFLEGQLADLPDDTATNRDAFAMLPPALQRRVIRRLVPDAGFLEVERIRRGDKPAQPEAGATSLAARVAARTCDCDPATFKARDQVGHLDADLVQLPLTVGSRKPGDRMRALGLMQPKRLQDILVDARVPRHLRDTLPLVSDGEEIVWIPGVTIAQSKRVTPATRHQLHLEIERG
jgi:tRNA(Ile)-lysidine synthetase-like protein